MLGCAAAFEAFEKVLAGADEAATWITKIIDFVKPLVGDAVPPEVEEAFRVAASAVGAARAAAEAARLGTEGDNPLEAMARLRAAYDQLVSTTARYGVRSRSKLGAAPADGSVLVVPDGADFQ
jgi:hypothetical protein